MSIRITCPTCSKTIKAPDHYAGRDVACPGCKSPLKIPHPNKPELEVEPRPVAPQVSVSLDHTAKRGFFSAGFGSMFGGVMGSMMGCFFTLFILSVVTIGGCVVVAAFLGSVSENISTTIENAEQNRTEETDREIVPNSKAMERIRAGMQKSQDKEDAVRVEIAADKEGVLFPKAETKVREAAESSLGTNVAAKGVITAEQVEDFGADKWHVTGTYRGPDRDGREFTSNWTVEFRVFLGNLQTMRTSLGTIEYVN